MVVDWSNDPDLCQDQSE